MKFKVLFLAFVGVVVLASLLLVLLPFWMLGWEYAVSFWSSYWYLLAGFLLLLVLLLLFYTRNRLFFSYLEEEQWDALYELLSNRIFKLRRVSRGDVQLYLTLAAMRGEWEAIRRLDVFLEEVNPAVHRTFLLELGLPLILSNEGEAIRDHYANAVGRLKGADREWSQWFHGYGLILCNEYEEAERVLFSLLDGGKNPAVRLLSFHALSEFFPKDEERQTLLEEKREAFLRAVPKSALRRYLDGHREELVVLIMNKLIADAVERVYV